MYENKIDHLTYSFFHKGILLDPLEAIEYEKKKRLTFLRIILRIIIKSKTGIEKKILPQNI